MSVRWVILVFGIISVASAQNGYSRDNPSNQLGYNSFGQAITEDESVGGEIPGEPGEDYPIYSKVPRTSFSCNNQEYPGYYADPESQCQAFYICKKSGRGVAFLCPNGTIFNQESLTCDWWYNFDCDKAEEYYNVNEKIAKEAEEAQNKLQEAGYNYNRPERVQNGGNGYQNVSPVYGVPNQSRRPNQNGNGYKKNYMPKPVYGPPRSTAGNGNSFAAPNRSYLPPANGNAFTTASFGYSDQKNPERTYLPPDNYSNGYQNGYSGRAVDRSYLPPSK